jgi:deoxycytidylate deaminase
MEGFNRCSYWRGLTVCRRVTSGCASGEGYEQCSPQMHAEINALEAAKGAEFNLKGATARIYGHTRVCSECKSALKKAGIKRILIKGVEQC